MPESPLRLPEHQPHIPSAERESPAEQVEIGSSSVERASAESVPVVAVPIDSSSAVVPIIPESTPRHQVIESILSEGLEQTFLAMPQDVQQRFKERGEETAKKIDLALSSTKVQVGKILSLILSWLQMIPGVNRFFVEQEAKIKADKLFDLRHRS